MSLTKRTALATIVAGFTATLVALGGVSAASAAGPGSGATPAVMPTAGSTATISIHKLTQGAAVGEPADGLEKTVAGTPLNGVTFTAQRIVSAEVTGADGTETLTFDLSTNVGWINASKLKVAADGSFTVGSQTVTPQTDAALTETTSGAGLAQFANLPIGLYVFTETAAPAGVTKAAPWLMTAPMTDPVGDGGAVGPNERWNYDLHVYPKNAVTGIEKTVSDATALDLGDPVRWTINADVPLVSNPAFRTGEAVSAANLSFLAPTAFVVVDDLDSRLSPFGSSPVAVSLVGAKDVTLTSADYGIAWTPAAEPGATMTLTFTEAGRAKLALAVSTADDASAVKVRVVLDTAVVSVDAPEGDAEGRVDGLIPNRAALYTNQAAVDAGTPVYSNTPETRWGDLVIRKVDSRDGSTPLAGAEFKIYPSEASAQQKSGALVVGNTDTFTTDASGEVRISGLRYSNFENGGVIAEEADWQEYWIVETKAPTGYMLFEQPMMVHVTDAGDAVAAFVVENSPLNAGFELPLTGGMGTAIFAIGGLSIIAVGLVLALRKRKLATR